MTHYSNDMCGLLVSSLQFSSMSLSFAVFGIWFSLKVNAWSPLFEGERYKLIPLTSDTNMAIWAGRKLHKNVESSIKQVLATTPHETPTLRTLAPHHENYTRSTNQTRRTLLEKQGRAHKRCTPVDPHTWMCKSGTTSTNLHTATMWGHRM